MFSFYINASLTTIEFKLIASTKSFVFPGTLPHVSQIKKKKFQTCWILANSDNRLLKKLVAYKKIKLLLSNLSLTCKWDLFAHG
jgi:hypothetical protein